LAPVSGIILPTCYFPPVSYFICLLSGNKITIETGETFPKQTLRNRFEIAGSNGKEILVAPVHKPHGKHTKTHEVFISPHGGWQKKHWRALQTTYSSSPFFLYYADRVHDLIFVSHPTLLEMNMHILEKILQILKVRVTYSLRIDYLKNPKGILDLRGSFSKKSTWEGDFREYLQVFSHKTGFLANLSILDLLFNLGPGTVDYLEESKGIIPSPSG
jgi:hypothetical protein